jgi:formylglycine-generating enzyme required for sulfatase activity
VPFPQVSPTITSALHVSASMSEIHAQQWYLLAKYILFIAGIAGVVLTIWLWSESSSFNTTRLTPTIAPRLTAEISQKPTPTVLSVVENTPGASPTQELGIGSTVVREQDGAVMVYVPAGEFTMGSDADDAMAECQKFRDDCSRDWFLDEEPPHQVYLDAFWIDQTEVTNSMYALCVKIGACIFPFRNNSVTRSDYSINQKYGNYPVMFVTWEQANTYCEWVSGQLPSEAQWEKAARGTDGRIYPWGNEFSGNPANFCDVNCSFPWAYKMVNDNYNDTAPVKSYEEGKSIYGAYDMAGNVWEWTSSLRKPYPYNPKDGREDLYAQGDRVLRGGSWNFNIIGLRSSNHDEYNDPELWINSIGFRCARNAVYP